MRLVRFLGVPLLAGVLAAAVAAQTFPITDFETFPAPSGNGVGDVPPAQLLRIHR
jgi:hypothetical protein